VCVCVDVSACVCGRAPNGHVPCASGSARTRVQPGSVCVRSCQCVCVCGEAPKNGRALRLGLGVRAATAQRMTCAMRVLRACVRVEPAGAQPCHASSDSAYARTALAVCVCVRVSGACGKNQRRRRAYASSSAIRALRLAVRIDACVSVRLTCVGAAERGRATRTQHYLATAWRCVCACDVSVRVWERQRRAATVPAPPDSAIPRVQPGGVCVCVRVSACVCGRRQRDAAVPAPPDSAAARPQPGSVRACRSACVCGRAPACNRALRLGLGVYAYNLANDMRVRACWWSHT
jgi:hypothetical protein